MKKKAKKSNIISRFFRFLYSILDKIIITPISKLAYFIKDKLTSNNGFIDRLLNKPHVLLYLSLILAFTCFILIDKKIITLTNNEVVMLTNQKVNVEYNEEAYVVEGIPSGADIILMGRKGDLFLAQQLVDSHEVTLDLTNYGVGTHKVKLDYKSPIKTLSYKLVPEELTVIIYPKISEVRTLSIDVVNTDKLDDTLVVSKVVLDREDIIIKSYKEKLESVTNVKAIVDVNSINATEAGTYTIENVKLITYDEKGQEVKGIEIVPETVTATITITSPSKTVPLKIVPKGEVRSGSAISSIESNVEEITVYADEKILAELEYIEVEIDVTDLSQDKVYQKYIDKPTGARSISENVVTITVKMEQETSKDIDGVSIQIEGLSDKFIAQGVSEQDTVVSVTVKGVQSLLDSIEAKDIKAYVDLSTVDAPGTYEVPVYATGSDVKLTYSSKTLRVKIIVSDAS